MTESAEMEMFVVKRQPLLSLSHVSRFHPLLILKSIRHADAADNRSAVSNYVGNIERKTLLGIHHFQLCPNLVVVSSKPQRSIN